MGVATLLIQAKAQLEGTSGALDKSCNAVLGEFEGLPPGEALRGHLRRCHHLK